MRVNDDDRTVRAMDVLAPRVGEIIGGSQREERLSVIEKRMAEMAMDKNDYWWYLESRQFGTVPHSGFGLGFERLMMMVTGISNIRDAIESTSGLSSMISMCMTRTEPQRIPPASTVRQQQKERPKQMIGTPRLGLVAPFTVITSQLLQLPPRVRSVEPWDGARLHGRPWSVK